MQCPKCTTTIGELDIDVLECRSIIGFEVGFRCPGCNRNFFCIVTSSTFLEVTESSVKAR